MTATPQGPLISIITAVYNNVATLQRCIDSIRDQSYGRTELIIIDGGSTDGTLGVIERNAVAIAHWRSGPDQGVYEAWNKGLDLCQGDWICFLGADDFFWQPDVLARLVPHLEAAHPRYRVVYGRLAVVNVRGELLEARGEPWPRVRRRFRQLMCIPHPGLMHHHSLFEEHGRFDPSFRVAGDYELLLRELRAADALFVPDLLVAGMEYGAGVSSGPANALLSLREARGAQQRHGLRGPGPHWLLAYLRVRGRQLLWGLCGEGLTRKILDQGRRLVGKSSIWTRSG